MKLLVLQQAEQQTLRDMGVFHPHPRVRIRAQAIVRLSQGLTLQQTANEFHVHLNSIEAWRQRWNKQGLMGLYEGHHTGRKRKWTDQQQETLRTLAQADGGSTNSLLRDPGANGRLARYQPGNGKAISARDAVQLQALPLQSNKKHPPEAFGKAARIIGELAQQARAGQCELLFYDESGFSPNPPIQSGWSPIGQTRGVEPLSHGERVNVLGALRHDHTLHWRTQRQPTVRDDVIRFFDELAAQDHTVPRIVVLDNASFHKGPQIEKCRRKWMAQGLFLYYLPP